MGLGWGWEVPIGSVAFKPKVPGQNDGAMQSVGLGGRRQLLGVMGERRGEREIDCGEKWLDFEL